MPARRARRRKDGPHPVDVHVGGRVRERRIELGISQERLAAELGLTFQQVQKYENAANRIAASRLYRIGGILGVPPGFFFEGYGGADGPPAEAPDPLRQPEAVKLLAAFHAIEDATLRRRMLDLAKSLAARGPDHE